MMTGRSHIIIERNPSISMAAISNNVTNNNITEYTGKNQLEGKQNAASVTVSDDHSRNAMSNIIRSTISTITNFGNQGIHGKHKTPNISELISQGDHLQSTKKDHCNNVVKYNNQPHLPKKGSRSNSVPKYKFDDLLQEEAKKQKVTIYLGDVSTVDDQPLERSNSKVFDGKTYKPLFKKRQPTTHLGELLITQPWRRLVEKQGDCNVQYAKIKKRSIHLLKDIFTTVIEIRWRYILLLFFASFNITWVFFAFIWWGIAVAHKDNLAMDVNSTTITVPCVDGVTDFVTAFLFSLETMHTIGYGTRAMTDECPIAVFILILQACFGVFMQSIMTGIVLAKIARPKSRGHTIMFSKNAVINKIMNGKFCLQFRVGDMRKKSHLVCTTIRAIVVEKQFTRLGQAMPLKQQNFTIVPETGSDVLLMTWPVIILHYIDENSFLFNMTPDEMFSAKFEIIVILEGTIEPTGMSAQVRTSYLPSEIIWGERLAPLISYNNAGRYMIDHTKFHETEAIVGEESGLDMSEI